MSTTAVTTQMPAQLVRHLRSWAGGIPDGPGVAVIANPRVGEPGWDGHAELLTGLVSPRGGCVVSLPPGPAYAARTLVGDAGPVDVLPAVLGLPDRYVERRVFRWATRPADLPRIGTWLAVDAPGVPTWLRPFGGDVLAALDPGGRQVAWVGLKRHDALVHELAVVTAPEARGLGIARALVAEAAHAVLAAGAIPTYLHLVENVASGRVAEAAGFADHGWLSPALDGA